MASCEVKEFRAAAATATVQRVFERQASCLVRNLPRELRDSNFETRSRYQ